MSGMVTQAREDIADGHTALGIELGSTRIKAVLTGPDHAPIAVGSHDWENQFVDRTWTYSLEAVWSGLQQCYAALAEQVRQRYDMELTSVGALGVSAMMHGYLAFDADGELLTPFRTWRNTNTGQAAERLSTLFGHNIPHRWSVAHLYQAILNGEEHLGRIRHLTTLAGYVHWRLTGEKVLGIGDASGMFPIDIATGGYDARMLDQFDQLASEAGLDLRLADLLPTIRQAGEVCGQLTAAGAELLDPTGRLSAGVTMCPPGGDAGVGMVHCNNGASELNAWVGLFAEFAQALGVDVDTSTVLETLFTSALDGDPDCGGLMTYNYLSGEPITELEEGRPLFLRSPDSALNLANFMRAHLFSSIATLRIGMDVLQKGEGVRLDRMFAHGGLFRTKAVAQRLLAAAIDTPVSVGDVAAEGGAWGIAVLAAFVAGRTPEQSLAEFLSTQVFVNSSLETAEPDPRDTAGFGTFIQRYVAALPVERAAVEHS